MAPDPTPDMIDISTATTFFAASVLLALSPGPDNVFVLLHSAVHGKKAGLLVVLGLCSGLLFHTAAVALGLAAVFAASATAFTALKLLGTGYLLYLAWGAWHAPVGIADSPTETAMSPLQTYLRGVTMNITNPKVAIFFLALLPQFADPTKGSMALQIVQLGAVFMLAALLTFSAVAWIAAGFGQVFKQSHTAQRTLNRVASVVFVGLALRLASAQR